MAGGLLKAKAMPHVHAHTGHASQTVEKVKDCQTGGACRGLDQNTVNVAARGRKAVACGKLLIFNVAVCRISQTLQHNIERK